MGLMNRPDGTQCNTIDESIDLLLNTLIPNDPTQQRTARGITNCNVPPVTEATLKQHAWGISPNKAPGADGITGRIVRVLWPQLSERLLTLTNACLQGALFPDMWKAAIVVPILKGRDTCIPKSYRPVSLLPVMGKIIEKVMNATLLDQIRPNLSGKQYGFTQNKSTLDAIDNLITWSSRSEERYVITIFLDITGAFDNLTWPALQTDMENLGVDQHMRQWVAEYLSGRTATMTIGGVSKSIRISKGCPQGSILGPTLWNVTMEALLRTEYPEHVRIQAYADDIAISVAGPNRASIVRRALQPALEWARVRGLDFSAAKSLAMMTKGTLAPGFTIAFGQNRIASVDRVKYLGVWLDMDYTFKPHVDSLISTEHVLFSRLRGTIGSGWGIRRCNLMTLYRCVFLPKVSYGVRFWAHATTSSVTIRRLGTLQRRALLGITGAYKTTSTEALQVVAGVPPLDLELRWLAKKEETKLLPANLRAGTLNEATNEMLDSWQTRWSSSSKGRWSYSCMPDIRNRLKLPLALGHEITQFLTGHGNFRAKLASFGLQPTTDCSCGNGEEDVKHVIYDCPLHSGQRALLELEVHRAGFLWPCEMKTMVSTRTLYVALLKFAKEVAYKERP